MLQSRILLVVPPCLVLLALVSNPFLTDVPKRTSGAKAEAMPATILSAHGEKIFNATPTKSTYGQLPIYFEPNQGQTDPHVKFIAQGGCATTFLTATEAVFALPIADWRLPNGKQFDETARGASTLRDPAHLGFAALNLRFADSKLDFGLRSPQSAIANRQSAIPMQPAITMRLLGANPNAQIEGLDRLPGISNYFIGKDPRKWQTNIPHYAKVCFYGVYPGIDVVYYGTRDQLEYDFLIAPGSDPRAVRLVPESVDRFYVDGSGDLVLVRSGSEIKQRRPVVYQQIGRRRKEIKSRYRIGDRQVGFEVETYDKRLGLVIDPVFLYSTPLPGRVTSVAVNAAGSAYVTGSTAAMNFATTPGAFQSSLRGESDAFVMNLDATGKTPLYATYLGGSQADNGTELAIDGLGNAYVTGTTYSDDFPTTPGAFQNSKSIFSGTFVAKLNTSGSMLSYSTYLGPTGGIDYSIAVDSSGNAYVTGQAGNGFPTTPGALQTSPTGAIVAKLNSAGSALVYSTFFGSAVFTLPKAIAVDLEGSAYVSGTAQDNFPTTPGAFQQSKAAGMSADAFVAKLNPAGTTLVYGTYLGGNNLDVVEDITVDANGNAYVTGNTSSGDFPTTAGAYDHNNNGFGGNFVAKFNQGGTALVYSTLGAGGSAIAVDSAGSTYVIGGEQLAKLNASGSLLFFSSNLNSPFSSSFPGDVAVDAAGNAYVAANKGEYRALPPHGTPGLVWTGASVSQISDSIAPVFVPIVLSLGGLNNSQYTSELTLTNSGNSESTIHFRYTAAYGGGSGTAFDFLPAGQQRIIPDAIAYLRSLGVPIPDSGARGGTLEARFTGLSSTSSAAATVRTTTINADGRAGLAYSGIPSLGAIAGPRPFAGTSYLCGLRQNATDRTNVAIQNVGSPTDGDIVLRLTLISGDPANPLSMALADQRLSPGEFRQINSILSMNGLSLTNAYVRVERISGTASYYAYAVINDQLNSDGSFVAPIADSELAGGNWIALPVMVETSLFSSELIITNWATTSKTVRLEYLADNIQTPDKAARTNLDLSPMQQLIIPNFVQYLRSNGVPGLSEVGINYAGPLLASIDGPNASKVSLGARTSAAGKTGRYGVFYSHVSFRDAAFSTPVYVYGLQQNSETRSNLGIVNLGFVYGGTWEDGSADYFKIEVFDGVTGAKVATIDDFVVEPKRWKQIDRILEQSAPGTEQAYIRVTRTRGSNPFFVYGVLNDGSQPGERTGDGAFVQGIYDF